MNVIETFELTKSFGPKLAVDRVSFNVAGGSCCGFLGPNGAGKSTCIKMLTGLIRPTSGRATLLGKPLGNVEARARVGYLPEMFQYQQWMTGYDLLSFHSELYRLTPSSERLEWALRLVGLEGAGKYKVGGYSKGMQQRIGLAAAMLPNPELLFLDEPTSALDPLGRRDMRDIILKLKSLGTTIFLNSHLLSEIETVCDYLAIINMGRICAADSLANLVNGQDGWLIRAEGLTAELIASLRTRFSVEITQSDEQTLVAALSNREQASEAARMLIDGGAGVYELTPRRIGLEAVFIRILEQSTYYRQGGVAQ